MKLMKMEHAHDPEHEEYFFFCPGCKFGHTFVIKWGPKSLEWRQGRQKREGKTSPAPTWNFDGNMDKPTFTPSLINSWEDSKGAKHVCHLFLTNGTIQFLADSSHFLAGHSVTLESVEY